jgi:hypothetical protein
LLIRAVLFGAIGKSRPAVDAVGRGARIITDLVPRRKSDSWLEHYNVEGLHLEYQQVHGPRVRNIRLGCARTFWENRGIGRELSRQAALLSAMKVIHQLENPKKRKYE